MFRIENLYWSKKNSRCICLTYSNVDFPFWTIFTENVNRNHVNCKQRLSIKVTYFNYRRSISYSIVYGSLQSQKHVSTCNIFHWELVILIFEKMKYILVTGGVISGVGKGVISSSFGTILKHCGIHVTSIKIDPYINLDAGTFSPYEHGKFTSTWLILLLL